MTKILPRWCRIIREPSLLPYAEKPVSIRQPDDVVRFLRDRLIHEEQEVFVVLCLDQRSNVQECVEVSRGTVNSSLVHPREVFRMAIATAATGIIVAHNHPSGDPTPSSEDRSVTKALSKAGELLEIPLYDHIIIAGERSLSFVSAGLL